MCSIFGMLALYPQSGNPHEISGVIENLNFLAEKSKERGSDGYGAYLQAGVHSAHQRETDPKTFGPRFEDMFTTIIGVHGNRADVAIIGNCRAEPTTEWVKEKQEDDQQPYVCGDWVIVHNGTIANDSDLRFVVEHINTTVDSAAIAEVLNDIGTKNPHMGHCEVFGECVHKLKGSFAILAINKGNPKRIHFACNYRPIWFSYSNERELLWFASAKEYLPTGGHMIPPYSYGSFTAHSEEGEFQLVRDELRSPANEKALVVCSGGLDSVVAATKMIRDGYDVTLAHFKYGSRAEGPEDRAIKEVAQYFGVPLVMLPMNIYKPEDSPLLQADSTIAGGEAGAEFAHEWVPARNLVMLALATAYCEAGGFNTLVLGNNLEEAGAYPDNEPEFIKKFNEMLPFAVGDGKRLTVVMPVGNLMKHEIVKLGHEIGAPLHLTWSCYRAGALHCGKCGPCFMRKTAFEINALPEVIQYAKS